MTTAGCLTLYRFWSVKIKKIKLVKNGKTAINIAKLNILTIQCVYSTPIMTIQVFDIGLLSAPTMVLPTHLEYIANWINQDTVSFYSSKIQKTQKAEMVRRRWDGVNE